MAGIILQQAIIMLILNVVGMIAYYTGIVSREGGKQLSNVVLEIVTPCHVVVLPDFLSSVDVYYTSNFAKIKRFLHINSQNMHICCIEQNYIPHFAHFAETAQKTSE